MAQTVKDIGVKGREETPYSFVPNTQEYTLLQNSHSALHDLVVVAEGALEYLVQRCVLLDHDLLRALLSPPHCGRKLSTLLSWVDFYFPSWLSTSLVACSRLLSRASSAG